MAKRGSQSKKTTAHQKSDAESTVRGLPQWPPLKPLVPTIDLQLQSLLQDQVIVVSKLFTRTLCQKYVSFLAALPLVTTPIQPKKGEAVRVNDRLEIYDPHFASILFSTTGLETLIRESGWDWGGEVCGLNPRIRIYRYTKGQFFNKHYDDENEVQLPGPIRAHTTWTLLLYLTGVSTGCVGGETVFYPSHGLAKESNACEGITGALTVSPEVGKALLHKHGKDCLLHEGREVVAGEKWVIRSDICVKG